MYTLYKFNFLNGISEINQLFDDILIIWPAPVFQQRDRNTRMHLLYRAQERKKDRAPSWDTLFKNNYSKYFENM